MRKSVVLGVLVLLPASCRADSFASVREIIRRSLAEKSVPSVAVAVCHHGKIVWEEGFGWADRENHVPASPSTPYTLGSVSKPLTATLVMVLVERNRIALDQPLNNYLGKCQLRSWVAEANQATVRRVAQHVGGLPGYYETFYPDESALPPAIETIIDRYGFLAFAPGRTFHYSNLGYTLLGTACASVTGKDYPALLKEEVLQPLGMSQSGAGLARGLIGAVHYGFQGETLPDYRTSVAPAADVYASAHDLARFGMFHLKMSLRDQKPILSERAIDESTQSVVSMGNEQYALGWRIQQDARGRRHVFHGGAAAGVDTELTLLPDEHLCVAVLANRTRLPGEAALSRVVTLAILASVLGGKSEDFRLRPPAPSAAKTGNPIARLAGQWVGAVHTPGHDVSITLSFGTAGAVRVQLAGKSPCAVQESRFDGSEFSGKIAATIDTPDTSRRPHDLLCELTLRDTVLTGVLYAVAKHPSRGMLLGFRTELQKQDGVILPP